MTDNLHSFLERAGCVVAEYRLRTCHYMLPDGILEGWVGWVRYECRTPHPESIAAINSLAHLASFIGVGWATAYGMGLTRPMNPRQRR